MHKLGCQTRPDTRDAIVANGIKPCKIRGKSPYQPVFRRISEPSTVSSFVVTLTSERSDWSSQPPNGEPWERLNFPRENSRMAFIFVFFFGEDSRVSTDPRNAVTL